MRATMPGVVLLLLACASASARAHEGRKIFSYRGSFDATLAQHLYSPRDLASQKLNINFEQRYNLAPRWKGALGFSGWDETSFATVPARYSGSVIRDDSRDLRFRNVYLQYEGDNFFIRVGNQQVVWGEAFGFFYSDIVNPKDLRYGLFGEFSDIRLQVPMVNAKLLFSNLSIQALAIPKPYFNILPSPGNDFSFPYQQLLPGVQNVQIQRETSLPIAFGNQDLGARIDYLFDRLDMSAFYFSYYDPNPWYVVDPQTTLPQNLVLDERHSRVQSFGLTATDSFGDFVFRFEGLDTVDRILPSVTATPFGPTLGTAQSKNDFIYVFGVDLPPFALFGGRDENPLNIGLQWSQDILDKDLQGLLRPTKDSLVSLRLQRAIYKRQTAKLLYTYDVSDAGQRVDFQYVIPLSGSLETRLGADVLGGPTTSNLGQNYEATRAYVLVRVYLHG